jgi:acetyl esterase/lipase
VAAVDVDPVLAETRAFNAELERTLADLPPVHAIPVDVTRRARREGRGIFPAPVRLPHAREIATPSRRGELRLRVLAPEGESTGVYLHFHGGGWTLGASDQQDVYLWEIVEATGLCAVSVEYRLAPEHPFPAGPDDCEDAARWLLDDGVAALGAPGRLVIGGESAGAHLAVLTLLRLRDRHGLTGAFDGANLVYGRYDLSQTPSSRLWDRDLVLSRATIEWFEGGFCPDLDLEQRRDPEISPLFADLRELPPALFTVGTLDPLLDDSLFMDARWRAAGNRSQLRIYDEAVHGFNLFPLAVSREANAAIHRFLAEAIA